jgi:hypothetical protein
MEMSSRKDKVNKKSAPRRDVLQIEKIGPWGRVEYHHLLSCGHTDIRKRIAPTKVIACALCVVAEDQAKTMTSIATTRPAPPNNEDFLDPTGSRLAVTESKIAKIRAEVASHFQVQVDAVDIATTDEDGELKLSYGLVFLSVQEIEDIVTKIDENKP